MQNNPSTYFEPLAHAFTEHPERSVASRLAYAMTVEAKYFKVTYSEKAMLPSVNTWVPNCAFGHKWQECIGFNEANFNEELDMFPERRDELFELKDKLMPYVCGYKNLENRTLEYVRFADAIACWGGTWIGHGNPDFGKLLNLGTDGIRKEIEEYRKKNPGHHDFYDSCKTAMDALDIATQTAQKTALENAAEEADPARKAEFLKIAEVLSVVPKSPAYDMYSAVMSFWIAFSVQGTDSPGNLDQYMFPYFQKSSYEECEALVRRMLEGFHDHRTWNVCISGSDEKWNDKTNELSYMILRLVTEMGYQTPNLTMRVHRNTPEKLWDMAVKSIGTGTGLPAIYNDEVVCVALEKIGIPPKHSHLYCMNGCNQIDILGKSHMGLEDGEVNVGKVLELMLHNGFNMLEDVPRKVMEPLGDIYACKNFEEFLALYYKYQDYVTDVSTAAANRCARLYAETAPNPLRTCLFEGCFEKAKYYKDGGPLYGHGQVLLEGLADCIDSLWAIQKLVYIEKKYTLRQMVNALAVNFEHYNDLWLDCKHCEKFGNNQPGPDAIAKDLFARFSKHLKETKCYRGGVFTAGMSTFNRSADQGIHTSALPNGKRKGETNYADSITATPGCDTNGPTASILSCLQYDQTEACSGFVTQMKFTKELFCSEKGSEAFKTLAKVYFAKGGQQLSVNVVDKETLLKAQKNPEAYQNLVVRVGGFSAYFNDLDKELQQNVINRTEFAI